MTPIGIELDGHRIGWNVGNKLICLLRTIFIERDIEANYKIQEREREREWHELHPPRRQVFIDWSPPSLIFLLLCPTQFFAHPMSCAISIQNVRQILSSQHTKTVWCKSKNMYKRARERKKEQAMAASTRKRESEKDCAEERI